MRHPVPGRRSDRAISSRRQVTACSTSYLGWTMPVRADECGSKLVGLNVMSDRRCFSLGHPTNVGQARGLLCSKPPSISTMRYPGHRGSSESQVEPKITQVSTGHGRITRCGRQHASSESTASAHRWVAPCAAVMRASSGYLGAHVPLLRGHRVIRERVAAPRYGVIGVTSACAEVFGAEK